MRESHGKIRDRSGDSPRQHDLFPTGAAQTAVAQQPRRAPAIPGWLRVTELLLFVILRLYIGVLVILLPWTELWRNNAFLGHWPFLAAFFSLGVVRGIVSGLGLLNIWIAISEILRRRALHS